LGIAVHRRKQRLSPDLIEKILARLSSLPDSPLCRIHVARLMTMYPAHDPKAIPMVQLSPARRGVSVGFLRHRGETPAA